MEEVNNQSSYSVIETDVLNDNRLNDSEKILYARLRSLEQNETKCCFASNAYLAKVSNTSEDSIKRRLKKLKECGLIDTKLIYKENSKEIAYRKITTTRWGQKCTEVGANLNLGGCKNALDNNISNSIISIVNKEKEIYKEKESSSIKKFTPPTLEELESFITEKQYDINAVEFISYYEMRDWCIGKNKMKDWKAAVRYWVSRKNTYYNNNSSNLPSKPKQKEKSWDELTPEEQAEYWRKVDEEIEERNKRSSWS